MVNDIWSKLIIVAACTLAGGREPLKVFLGEEDPTCALNTDSSPCSGLEKKVELWHVVTPIYIAGVAWLIVALPTIFLAGRHKSRGVQSLIFTLALLWIHLLISYYFVSYRNDIVGGYVWSVHAAAHVLASWKPKRFVLVYQGIQPWVAVLGVLCIAAFARQFGAPIGIVSWHSGRHAQCGLITHFFSMTSIDFLDWVMGPVRVGME